MSSSRRITLSTSLYTTRTAQLKAHVTQHNKHTHIPYTNSAGDFLSDDATTDWVQWKKDAEMAEQQAQLETAAQTKTHPSQTMELQKRRRPMDMPSEDPLSPNPPPAKDRPPPANNPPPTAVNTPR